MKSHDRVIYNGVERGGTIFEFVACFTAIFILVTAFGVYVSKVILVAKETVLRSELSNLRHSLEVYKVYNRASPADLKDLYNTRDYFVSISRLNNEGRLCDPFGHEYVYDPEKCRIRLGTLKYSRW